MSVCLSVISFIFMFYHVYDINSNNHRAPSCHEIPEILQMSWNCPEIRNCREILLIWSECPEIDLCYAVITALPFYTLFYKSWLRLCWWHWVSS